MNTLSVNVEYRPVRIGWCVRENNLEDYKKALRLSHTLWGGRYNPLIPIDNFEAASELVNFFKVDVLFPVSDDELIVEFIDKFPHLPWPHDFNKDLFISWIKRKEPVFLDIFQAALRLRSDLNKEHAFSKFKLNLINWEETDPLSAIFDAMFGSVPLGEELGIAFDYKELLTDTLSTKIISLKPTETLDPVLIQAPTINWLTSNELLARQTSSLWNIPGFYIGGVNNFNDLVNFWNLRACGIELMYYDPIFKDRFIALKNYYLGELRKRPPTDYESFFSVGIWLQESNHDKFDQTEFEGEITLCRIGHSVWNELNVKSPFCHFKGQTVLGVLSDQNDSGLSFQLPPKPICDDSIGQNQYLIATVKVYGDVASEEETFGMPYIPNLNLFYGQNNYAHTKVRVEPSGLGFFIQHHDTTLQLRAIKTKKLIQEIFRLHGLNITPSDAGIKTTRLIKQLGNIQNCRIFKVLGVRQLIEKYKPSSSFKKSNAIQIIGQNDPSTGRPNFEKYNRLYIDGAPVNPQKIFNYLTSKGVFRAGLELKCPHCDLTFWRVIDDLKSDSICEYCGHKFEILSQLKDRDWAYRRSGIFGLDDHQAGGIPVALTLQQLAASNYSAKFLYVTAMNIEEIGSNPHKCETDFIIITCDHNGKISLVISECKTRQEITNEDVHNLAKIADTLSNNYVDVYILFSKLTEFSEEEVKTCMQAQGQYLDRVILLTDRELESLFIYEEAKKYFQIDEHATGWDRMALNTKAIFQEKRKRS